MSRFMRFVAVGLTVAVTGAWGIASEPEGRKGGVRKGDVQRVASDDLGFVPGEVLVKFTSRAGSSKVSELKRLVGAKEIQRFSGIEVRHWRLDEGVSVKRALALLSARPLEDSIEFVEPNYIYRPDAWPNDTRRGDLWGLHNFGRNGGALDADIDALEAWEAQTGSRSVVVAILDTGIDYLHEDLSANIWLNAGEDANGDGVFDEADLNGVDDDHNGYVDDGIGWNFAAGTNDPMDFSGHGTHVAGTVGAVGNNGIGVSGVNWNVSLMPLKGDYTTAGWVRAIRYAAAFRDETGRQVVRVANASWISDRRSKTLEKAMDRSGILFACSAGNHGSSEMRHPAGLALENVIAVAATTPSDELVAWSAFGDWVDLAAPGVDVLSTLPADGYGWKSGTSMAAPHVAGAAALLMAADPALDNLAVKAALFDGVDLLPSLTGLTVTGGRLNLRTPLGVPELQQDVDGPLAVTDLGVTEVGLNTIRLGWTAVREDAGNPLGGPAYLYDLRYLVDEPVTEANWASATPAEAVPPPQPAGLTESFTLSRLEPSTNYHIALQVVDEAGNSSSLSNVASALTLPIPPGGWIRETVDAEGDAGFFPSIALDESDRPHISYGADWTVKYARWTGSVWDIVTVPDDPANSLGRWTSLALGPGDVTHLTYLDDTRHVLQYARLDAAGWQIETVDNRSPNGNWNSLVLDTSGRPHVSYRMGWDEDRGELKYAYRDASGWVTDVVGRWRGAALGGTCMALDAADNPLIGFHNADEGSLVLARRIGNRWRTETVDQQGHVGDRCSLVLDQPSGDLHISYIDADRRAVKYAQWTESTGWTIEVVDTEGDVGWTSLAVDSFGIPHIGYTDNAGAVLKYARRTGSSAEPWEIEVVEPVSLPVAQVSLALDGDGSPHISYADFEDYDLKYARRAD